MDYFLFNFSGVQFHYTMSHFIFLYDKSSFCDAEAALLFIRHIYFIKSFNPRIRITFQVKHRLRSDWSKNIGTQAPTIPSLQ